MPSPGGSVSRRRFANERRRMIAWTAAAQPFTPTFTRRRWSPFFSVLFFLPRVEMRVTNIGAAIDYATLAFEVAAYEGEIGSVSSIQFGWSDTEHHEIGQWASDETKVLRLTIRSSSLPRDGTYVARVRISQLKDVTTPQVAALGGVQRVGTGESWLAFLLEYFRVEPTSTVMTFWGVIGTLAAATAAFLAVVVSLVR